MSDPVSDTEVSPRISHKPFEALDDARAWVAAFVRWYNAERRHSGIRFVTPDERHNGLENAVLANPHDERERHVELRPATGVIGPSTARARVYERARSKHPALGRGRRATGRQILPSSSTRSETRRRSSQTRSTVALRPRLPPDTPCHGSDTLEESASRPTSTQTARPRCPQSTAHHAAPCARLGVTPASGDVSFFFDTGGASLYRPRDLAEEPRRFFAARFFVVASPSEARVTE